MKDVPLVAEFRNEWWIKDKTFEFLREHGIGYCCVDEPDLPRLPPPVVMATSPIGYVRFHGRNKAKWFNHQKMEERYNYEYSEDELRDWAVRMKILIPVVKKLFVFFNNHPRGQAVRNAIAMIKLLAAPGKS